MFKVLKAEQKSVLDDTLESTYKPISTFMTTNSYKKYFIVSSNKNFLKKKKFRTTKSKILRLGSSPNRKNTNGLWDKSEHYKFIDALYIYNCKWFKISEYIENRTYNQICSHAQKFFIRLKSFKDSELGLDFTSESIVSLKAIVDIVKEKEKNLNIYKKLLYTISEKISFGKKIRRTNKEKISLNINTNDFNLCKPTEDDNFSNCNLMQLNSENNNEVDENNENIEYSSDYNLSYINRFADKEIEEISIANFDRKNLPSSVTNYLF